MLKSNGYTPYGGLLEHHLRIGDTEFYVPPTSISVHRQMKNERARMLRARNSMPKESGYSDRVIEFTLFFPGRDSINTELRSLIAQLKKCPFLPLENTYLNDIHKIDAVTLSGVTVQTTPGFPNTLQAQIQCYAFEPASYIADEQDLTFDEMFDWPLFRWYYQRNLNPQEAGAYTTYYEPLYEDLNNTFKFRIAAMDDLDAMAKWRKEKKVLIRDYMKDKRESFWGNEKREEDFNATYNGLYDKAMYEYNLHYEDWDIPGLILTDFSVGFENTISSIQLQDDASPTHQYLGSQDTMLTARFKTNNQESLASFENLIQRSSYMIRNYHKEVANGFVELDHQLARLFGVRNVTIEDVQTNTVEGQPGTYEVTLTMTAYNRIERKLNEVKWISESAEWNIDKYEDQGFWSLLTSLNPATWDMGMGDGVGAGGNDIDPFSPEDLIMDAPVFSPIMRWTRFLWDRPAAEQIFGGLKVWAQGHNRSEVDFDEDDIKNIIYDESIKQFFRAAEVYPDLELPTYGEVAMAGFDIENTNNGIFVEPDFFIKYQDGVMFYEDLMNAIKGEYKTVLRDATGGEAEMNGDQVMGMNDVTKKQTDGSKKEYKEAAEELQVAGEEVPKGLKDKANLSPADMEALIRKKADEIGINQNLPVAFALTMDSELKQFFDKGTNAKQDKVVSSKAGKPIMMSEDFDFYTDDDDEITGEYVGAMKVRRMYGSNVNMLAYNIDYNVEAGVQKMADFYRELERIHARPQKGDKAIYNEKYVYDLFGLKQKPGTLDSEKARFAGVVMMYLGFQKEYLELVKNNKKPPKRLTALIKAVLARIKGQREWSDKEIASAVRGIPIKDFKTGGEKKKTAETVGMTTKDFENDDMVHKGMMHDMLRYDRRGRLVRAFPTFFMTFIDEGQYIGSVKMSDQFFQYQAVMDIMYTNSRKEASSTLVLEMSNVFGTLDDAEKGMDLTNTGYSEVFKAMTMPGAVAKEAERSRHRNQNYYKSIMLRTGTRIHFRMGYGSNPMDMPTIMNGAITSIQNNGESITVIAQDDGIEMTNKIRADVNETTDGGFLFSKQEPTEIVDELLTDSQGFFKNLWAGLSNKEFNNHSLGLMHFGSQGAPQGWGALGSFFGGATVGAAGGALAAGPIGAVAGALGGGMFNTIVSGKEHRPMAEINLNVYQTTGLTNEEHDQWWNQIKDAFGIGKADEPGINIGLYDKSVWDVMNIAAAVGDDHIVAVHPFGFRNTIYSGKTYFPLHYEYIVEDGKVKGTAVKPFRQFHVYDSTTSIIDNTIETTEENVRTVGVGVYMNEGEMDTTSPVYVDTDIWPEKQRTVNIDTTLNAQGIRLVEKIPLIGGLLNKPNKWYFDEGVAIKITARGLSDYVRDMYDGYLTVMGDPSVKPYDQMWIYDTYNDIVGPADVKEVTQIMNHEVGYITMLKPDAVVVNSDRRSMGFMMGAQAMAGSALIQTMLRKKLRNSKYAGNMPILNSVWASSLKGFDKMKSKFKAGGKASKNFFDRLTGKMAKNKDQIEEVTKNREGNGPKESDVSRWKKNGMLEKLQKLLGDSKSAKLEDLFKNARKIGSKSLKYVKLSAKAGKLIASGTRKIRPMLKGVATTARLIWGSAHALAGPVGWLALAIEALVVHIVCSTVGEFIERWLFMRQACLIAPLTKGGLEFSAGINGHKGSVVGDSPDFWQSAMTNWFSATLLGFIGVDAWQYRQDEREGEMQSLASSASKIDTNKMALDIHKRFRVQPTGPSDLEKLYEVDRKASLTQVNKRLELLDSRDTKAIYGKEGKSWDDYVSSIGDKIKGWFGALWEKVKGAFGSSNDGGVCIPKGDVPTDGKAKGLSSYFKVLGPKLEAEAKKQGLSHFIEIIKAKVMQESSGNYIAYPDVMQASESLGKPIGYIKNVDASIKQGVKYFGEIVAKCNGDIKLALQSYNYGGGFITYVQARGGKYTKQLAWNFAEEQVRKHGRISRIPPGYGDSSYVDHVLRYYDGNLPSGECEGGETATGGTKTCPAVVGTEGKMKYQTSGGGLIDCASYKGRNFGITLVGGTSQLREGTIEGLITMAKLYKQATGDKFNLTSGNRPGDTRTWHGTGWAADIDTPNTMRMVNGKFRFPPGNDKEKARKLCIAALESGFRTLYFGDWDICQELGKKYGANSIIYEPSEHLTHLHVSYPLCKNKKGK